MIPQDPSTARGQGVRVITLDNPPVNALSFAYCAKLREEIAAAQRDEAVGVVIVTGHNGLFSGGADVNDFNREIPPNAVTIRDVIADIEASEKIFVAAIDGTCLGGGLELALTCDYRVATERSKLGIAGDQTWVAAGRRRDAAAHAADRRAGGARVHAQRLLGEGPTRARTRDHR